MPQAPPAPSTSPIQASIPTLPPAAVVPAALRRPLRSSLVHVLDPAAAHPAGSRGRWWRPTRLRAGLGCDGLQIDGPGFSQVLVVEFG